MIQCGLGRLRRGLIYRSSKYGQQAPVFALRVRYRVFLGRSLEMVDSMLPQCPEGSSGRRIVRQLDQIFREPGIGARQVYVNPGTKMIAFARRKD